MTAQDCLTYLKKWITISYHNYNYLWLKSMLQKAQEAEEPGSTLIIGNSYAVHGVYESAWKNAISCSVESQDLYYHYCCIRSAVTRPGVFNKCILILGYYAMYGNLSLSINYRNDLLGRIYYPIFKDSHNWKECKNILWEGMEECSQDDRLLLETVFLNHIKQSGTYYGSLLTKPTVSWNLFSEQDKDRIAKERATNHNKSKQHIHSIEENQKILSEIIQTLYQNNITPILVIPPFTKHYNQYINQEMKALLLKSINQLQEDVYFIDFNEKENIFDDSDFMDSDHLSLKGAKKFSEILSMLFGE